MAVRLKIIPRLPQPIKIISFRHQIGSVSTRFRSSINYCTKHVVLRTSTICSSFNNYSRRYFVTRITDKNLSVEEAELNLEQYLETQNVDGAFEVLNDLKRAKIPPTLAVYRTIIKICQAAEQPKRILELLQGIEGSRDADRSSFEILLSVAESTNNETLAQQLWQAIKKGVKQFQVRIHDLTILAKSFENNIQKTMEIFEYALSEMSYDIDSAFVLQIIKNCSTSRSHKDAIFIHHSIPKGLHNDHTLSNAILEMYSQCTSFETALQIFESMKKDVVTWNIMLGECRHHKKYDIAMRLFDKMLRSKKWTPNERTLVHMIGICSDSGSQQITDQVVRILQSNRIEMNSEILTSLINMFGKTGNVDMALSCFERMKDNLDVVAWSALMNAYIDNQKPQEALKVFEEMKQSGVQPDRVTCSILLKVCIATGAIDSGKKIHAYIQRQKMDISPELEEQLLSLYAMDGGMESAVQRIGTPKYPAGWNAILKECRDKNDMEGAYKILQQMISLGTQPDEYTFSILFGLCKNTKSGEEGKRLHQMLQESGLRANAALYGNLVAMYAKCGMVKEAIDVMNKFEDRDIMAYNNLLLACRDGHPFEAVDLYKQMIKDRINPDEWTMTHMLKICGYYRLLDFVPVIETDIVKFKLDQSPSVQKSAAAMKDLLVTREQRVKSFNSTLDSLRVKRNLTGAFDVLRTMTKSGVPPDERTFDILMQALNDQPSETFLEELNQQMDQWRFHGEARTLASFKIALKKDINQAIKLFKEANTKTSTMWTDLISELNNSQLLLEVYQSSSPEDRSSITPKMYSPILNACSQYGTIELVKSIHEELNSRNILQDNTSALVAAYSKLGNKSQAMEILKKLPNADSAAYHAMIVAYKNDVRITFQLFNEMVAKNIKPSQGLLTELVILAASMQNVQIGQQLQLAMVRLKITPDYPLAKELIRMYSACGKLAVAVSLCREWCGSLISSQNRPEVWETILKTCTKEDVIEAVSLMTPEEKEGVDIQKILKERPMEGNRMYKSNVA